MAKLRAPSIRYTIGNAAPCLRNVQRRWAQVHDVRLIVTHQESDKVTRRYQEKLRRKAKEEGLKDIGELKAVYQEKINSQRKRAAAATPRSPFPPSPYPPTPSAPQSAIPQQSPWSATKTATPPGVIPLSSYIDIPKTLELPPRELEYVWRLRHASDPRSLCAVIPQTTYTRIESTARRHPQFILPLPRKDQGAEIHFLQWTFPTPTTTTVLFTQLAEFKLRGEHAQPHTTVTHHLDLREEKGLVLLHGNVMEGRGISVDEGKWLLMCLQKFYGLEGENAERRRLLDGFSKGDQAFKIEELLEEAEKIA